MEIINYIISFLQQTSNFLQNLTWKDFYMPLIIAGLGGGLGSVAGSWIGAKLAFKYNINNKIQEGNKNNIALVNHTLSRLLYQLSILHQYFQSIEPHLNAEEIKKMLILKINYI